MIQSRRIEILSLSYYHKRTHVPVIAVISTVVSQLQPSLIQSDIVLAEGSTSGVNVIYNKGYTEIIGHL